MAKCNGCGEIIDEPDDLTVDQRNPCPSCDSKARLFEIELKGEPLSTIYHSDIAPSTHCRVPSRKEDLYSPRGFRLEDALSQNSPTWRESRPTARTVRAPRSGFQMR